MFIAANRCIRKNIALDSAPQVKWINERLSSTYVDIVVCEYSLNLLLSFFLKSKM